MNNGSIADVENLPNKMIVEKAIAPTVLCRPLKPITVKLKMYLTLRFTDKIHL
ncbi:MAG: hypothetical protein KME05_21045 [Gloeocapsa sp. UFS-A4-WI-NPMV-4B04]|nr:hypothetical protein [Gloeocapsa sp. UFS-A4-WI-NPMV-4B04]